MNKYVRYYHDERTHLGLEKQTPNGGLTMMNASGDTKINCMPRIGGLHHRYDLAA